MRGLYWTLAGAVLLVAVASAIAGEAPYGATQPATPTAPEPATTETPATAQPAHEAAETEGATEVAPVKNWIFVLRSGKLIKFDPEMKELKVVDLSAELGPMARMVKIRATDEGVFVIVGNRLWRFDNELNLQKKVEIPESTKAPEK